MKDMNNHNVANGDKILLPNGMIKEVILIEGKLNVIGKTSRLELTEELCAKSIVKHCAKQTAIQCMFCGSDISRNKPKAEYAACFSCEKNKDNEPQPYQVGGGQDSGDDDDYEIIQAIATNCGAWS